MLEKVTGNAARSGLAAVDQGADRLAAHGIDHVFMLTGGGAMHLNHALGTHPKLTTTFTHHEQALAMAAEAYYRLTNRLAVVNVTSGPGGTNAITGVYGAHVDSIGMLVISGQVKTETTVRATGLRKTYGDKVVLPDDGINPQLDISDLPPELLSLPQDSAPVTNWEQALRQWADQALARGQSSLLDSAVPAFERIMIETALKHTAADVHFMSGMIHHHAQAVLIAQWAPTHGAGADLQRLCERINYRTHK